jgi:hypothetical protein
MRVKVDGAAGLHIRKLVGSELDRLAGAAGRRRFLEFWVNESLDPEPQVMLARLAQVTAGRASPGLASVVALWTLGGGRCGVILRPASTEEEYVRGVLGPILEGLTAPMASEKRRWQGKLLVFVSRLEFDRGPLEFLHHLQVALKAGRLPSPSAAAVLLSFWEECPLPSRKGEGVK